MFREPILVSSEHAFLGLFWVGQDWLAAPQQLVPTVTVSVAAGLLLPHSPLLTSAEIFPVQVIFKALLFPYFILHFNVYIKIISTVRLTLLNTSKKTVTVLVSFPDILSVVTGGQCLLLSVCVRGGVIGCVS